LLARVLNLKYHLIRLDIFNLDNKEKYKFVDAEKQTRASIGKIAMHLWNELQMSVTKFIEELI